MERGKYMGIKFVKYPCRNCIYFNTCGNNSRTNPCKGRTTKSEREKKNDKV